MTFSPRATWEGLFLCLPCSSAEPQPAHKQTRRETYFKRSRSPATLGLQTVYFPWTHSRQKCHWWLEREGESVAQRSEWDWETGQQNNYDPDWKTALTAPHWFHDHGMLCCSTLFFQRAKPSIEHAHVMGHMQKPVWTSIWRASLFLITIIFS